MFAAAVLVCSVQAGLCAAITDTDAGPYATHAECNARVEEMLPVAVMYLQQYGLPGPYKVVKATCTLVQEV